MVSDTRCCLIPISFKEVTGEMQILPYFCPPPVPLTCVCEKPVTGSGIDAHPAFGNTPQSGPGFTMPKGMQGPGNVRPTPTDPIFGSTYFQFWADTVIPRRKQQTVTINPFILKQSSLFEKEVCHNMIVIQHTSNSTKYPEPGSNRHGLPHWCLRPARLPIPPSGLQKRCKGTNIF